MTLDVKILEFPFLLGATFPITASPVLFYFGERPYIP
jgi:hypothetical protein